MKLFRFLILVVILAAFPAAAQDRSVDVSVFASFVDPSGDNTVSFDEDQDDIDVEFDSEQGYGLVVNFFFSNRLSAEFAASVVEPELSLRAADPTLPFFAARDLELIPLTAVLQFHFSPNSRFDPYIGAGGAYVLFDDVEGGDDLDDIDVEEIDLEDDVGFVVNAGVGIGFGPSFGLYLDAKYVPVKSSATAVFVEGPGSKQDIEVNPLILSAGLTFKF